MKKLVLILSFLVLFLPDQLEVQASNQENLNLYNVKRESKCPHCRGRGTGRRAILR